MGFYKNSGRRAPLQTLDPSACSKGWGKFGELTTSQAVGDGWFDCIFLTNAAALHAPTPYVGQKQFTQNLG